MLAFHDSEGVEDFVLWVASIVIQLATLGDPKPDDKVVLKYLRITRPRYKQLVLSIETLLDVSTLTIEEVIGRLKMVEDDGIETSAIKRKLLLTEDEWREKINKKEVDDGSHGGSNADRGSRGRGGRNRDRGRGHDGRGDGIGPNGRRGNYHRCGKPGHWAQECWSKQAVKKEEHAYAAQEESSLLLAEIDSVESPDSSKLGSGGVNARDGKIYGEVCNHDKCTAERSVPTGERVLDDGLALGASSARQMQGIVVKKVVHITEEKVYAALGDEVEKDSCRWVLDTGASNHMSGCWAAFSSIDDSTIGMVKFTNGSVVKIDGIGTILYQCKDGEHHSRSSVYFIPKLTTNIISVGRLDECGYEVQIKGGVMLL
jgi:hypothetical protein